MWEYYHFVLPAKVADPKGPPLSFDTAVGGQGPQALAQQHQAYTNQLGAQGWEMVSCAPVSVTDGITSGLYFVFKRRKG
jgi:Domain of unknown function (DUF4177)